MAAAFVAENLLSAAFNGLVEWLRSGEFMNFFSKRKIDDALVDKLRRNLTELQVVLDDAQGKQITNKNVEIWLDDLQDVVYQAEDLLEEIATKALKDKLEADHNQSQTQTQTQSSTTLVDFDILRPFKKLRGSASTSNCLSDEAIECRMKEIIDKLECFVERKNSLNLRENVRREQWPRQEATSLVDESEIYGRNNDKEKIIELLLSENASRSHIPPVIPIVGMGGMGKTTLAQLVYNDARVKKKFHVKSWVCISNAFDSYKITKKILDDVTQSSNNNIDSLDKLQIELQKSLTGKKFLIVLDDVWNHSYNDWDSLKRPFSTGTQESRIIVTTRIDDVALAMSTVPRYPLEQLSFEDSWSLFANHAFGSKEYMPRSDLKSIGKQIVDKCKGLPLAVKSLGGILRSKQDIEDWKIILKSEIWDLDSDISPALRLSYHYLPSHLKRCFAHCSKFPKDYEFEKEKLVRLWIAEDLVQRPKNNRSVEDEGNYYFRELLSRYFFQRLGVSRSFFHRLGDKNSYFVMHDLFHDLAKHISGKFCVRLDDDKPLDDICQKVRHFSYVQGQYDAFEKFKVVNEVKYLRTFISFPRVDTGYWRPFLGSKVLNEMLPSLRCLRVLSLTHYNIFELPQSIENLIHLRYLDLSWTLFKELPDSITTLYNLQTLDLSCCHYLIELPVNIGKLIKLRHLDIRGTKLTEMQTQMSRLKDLQHLTYFVVGKDCESKISGLKELCQLRGQFCITELQNVTSGLDASEANLEEKEHLEGLELKWGGNTHNLQTQRNVLDKLRPHAGVKDLRITNYGGTRFPDWLESGHLFSGMVSLNLIHCANCSSLPAIGQLPSLKNLRIEGMKAIREVGQEFYGNASSSWIKPFQCLETLSFEGMSEWEEWHALGAEEFSQLLVLSVIDCPKLRSELSIRFPSLRKLEISKRWLLQGLPVVPKLKISAMTKLTELVISNIPKLTELPQQLQKLEISNVPNLKELPQELCRLVNLERLMIENCGRLVSFPDVGLPPMLKTLEIKRCERLQSLAAVASSEEGINNCRLEELRISQCSSLVEVSLPIIATLKTLYISKCGRLEFPLLSEEHNYHMTCSIEVLRIVDSCDLLKSLWLGFFPKLRSLEIKGCINLETLLIRNELQNLVEIRIGDCPKMVYFPHGDGRLPNLTKLEIFLCKNLKSLPEVQSLIIGNCPEVESLPSNLSRLEIFNCEKLMKGRMGWGLQQTSLKDFTVIGDREQVLESFPEEWLLPTTLTSLSIRSLPNLKSLNHKGLQHLTSLQCLYIVNCPKLQSLPEEGLPNSLSELHIWDCPLLKPRCQREKGEDWSKISPIRHIDVDDGEEIVNLE